MKKEYYEKPEMVIVQLEEDSIIITSGDPPKEDDWELPITNQERY